MCQTTIFILVVLANVRTGGMGRPEYRWIGCVRGGVVGARSLSSDRAIRRNQEATGERERSAGGCKSCD